jgi:spermidine synthase
VDIETLGRANGVGGEVVLRRRHAEDGCVEELIVNGAFAMDSAETSTERELGRFATDSLPESGRVLVGGLGLGYSAAAVLTGPVGGLDIVEREDCLLTWARAGLTPTLARVAADPRVRLWSADVQSVLAGAEPGPTGPWDAIILDVDNGPDFLLHEDNGGLYREPGLRQAYGRLASGGTLAIWCQGPAPDLWAALQAISPTAEVHEYAVTRQGRDLTYVIYVLTSRGRTAAGVAPE